MHILNGDSAAGSFKEAFHISNEELLSFRDVLSCWQLTDYSDIQQWSNQRLGYWEKVYYDQGFNDFDDIAESPCDFYTNFDALLNADNVTVWIGCALSDHLLMVFVVMLFDHYGLDFNKLTIRQYEKFEDNKLPVIGMGMLSPDQIKQLKPQATSLNQQKIDFCLETWKAVTAATPDLLSEILHKENTSLPLLHNALQNLIYRFPDVNTSLSRFDELILNAAKNNTPNTAKIIGSTMKHEISLNKEGSFHALDTVGDMYIFNRLKVLGRSDLNKPLLSLDNMKKSMGETKTELTAFGLEVLEGLHNVVEVNGIDDWVCGVHLDSSTGETWFRDGRDLVVKRINPK